MNSSEDNATQNAFENGQDIFKSLLNFLKFVVDKRCFTKQHYHLVRREFVMEPHLYNETYKSLLVELLPLMYPGNSSAKIEEDWNEWNGISPNVNISTTSDADTRESCFQNLTFTETPLAWDWNFPTCEINDSHINNLDFLKTMMGVESVFQLIIGIIGIASNLLAIPILCNKSMRSVFNKLLICLLILHTIYIFCSILSETLWPEWEKDDQAQISNFSFIILFSFILHPLKQLMLFSSIFITVLMARQRYLAIRHPVEYRNFTQSTNPWKAALKYLIVVMITATLLAFPLYFETQIIKVEKGAQIFGINSTHFQYKLEYETEMMPGPIRLNWHYVIWFKNFMTLFATLILPFILLAYWNFKTLTVIRRRRRMRNRPGLPSYVQVQRCQHSEEDGGDSITPETAVVNLNQGTFVAKPRLNSDAAKREEARKARILFIIVAFFVVCNLPRVVLNLEELVSIAPFYWNSLFSVDNSEKNNHYEGDKWCYSTPIWAHILRSISNLLLTLNASVCCFVYCVVCRTFRMAMSHNLHDLAFFILKTIRNLQSHSH